MADPFLDFERSARRDFRIWLAAVAGGLLSVTAISSLAQSGPLMVEDMPLWMSLIFLVAGLGMAALTLVALIANTSRGCRVDTDNGTLTWWQMRFARQQIDANQTIALADVDRIVVDNSSDSLSVALYDIHGKRHESFGELTLPPDHNVWLAALVKRHPHIQIERR